MLRFDPSQILPVAPVEADVLRPTDGAAGAGSANVFQATLQALSASNRSALTAPAAAVDSIARTGPSPLGLMQAHEQRIEAMMVRAHRSQDMNLMLKAGVEMADQSTRFDIAAKAIGKSVSAVDALTKLN